MRCCLRNYCGDVIREGIRGPNVNSYSSYDSIEGTEFNKALAGVDYTLTCDDDPEAFKLITGDELNIYHKSVVTELQTCIKTCRIHTTAIIIQ